MEVVSFTPPAALLPGKDPNTHCVRGWVGPRAGLDAVAKIKDPFPPKSVIELFLNTLEVSVCLFFI